MRKVAIRNQEIGISTSHRSKLLFSSYYFLVTNTVDGFVKGCVKVWKSLFLMHNVIFTIFTAVVKPVFFAQFLQAFYSLLSTASASAFNLFMGQFSTQSTGLITKTTIYKKKLMMERTA